MVRLVASLLLALCLTPVLVLAQSDTATVSGLVTDSKGAVLVGAQVRAVNVEAGTRSTHLPTRTVCMCSTIFVPDSTGSSSTIKDSSKLCWWVWCLARRMRWAVTLPCRLGRSSSPSPSLRPARP